MRMGKLFSVLVFGMLLVTSFAINSLGTVTLTSSEFDTDSLVYFDGDFSFNDTLDFGSARYLSSSNDSLSTLIYNSNGNFYPATGSNLQSAIWDLNGSGGIVWLPCANIEISSKIYLSTESNITIVGQGNSTIISIGTNNLGTDAMMQFDYCDNIIIEKILFEGNKWLDGGVKGNYYNLLFKWCENVIVRDCTFIHAWDDNLVFHNTNYSSVTNCWFYDAHDEGEGISTANAGLEIEDGSHNISVMNLFAFDCKQIIVCHSHSSYNGIRDVVLSNLFGSMCEQLVQLESFDGAVSKTRDIFVYGGLLFANESSAYARCFWLSNCTNINIEDITVHNTKLYTAEDKPLDNVTFIDCYVYDDDGSFSNGCVYFPTGHTNIQEYISFINVNVFSSNTHGFQVQGGTKLYFERCKTIGTNVGFYIFPSSIAYDVDLINCRTLNTQTEGIEIHNIERFKIEGCKIKEPATGGANDGIKIYGCFNGTVTGNVIGDDGGGTLRDCIAFYAPSSSDIIISNNHFYGFSSDAIQLLDNNVSMIFDNIGYDYNSLFPLYCQAAAPTPADNSTVYWLDTDGPWLYQVASSYGSTFYVNMSDTP